jgi:hypothetical protein
VNEQDQEREKGRRRVSRKKVSQAAGVYAARTAAIYQFGWVAGGCGVE